MHLASCVAKEFEKTSAPVELRGRVHQFLPFCTVFKICIKRLLGRHGSDSLCRDEQENKMAATYNVLAFKR